MILIAKVHSDNDCAGPDYALVRAGPDFARTLVRRQRTAKQLLRQIGQEDLACLQYRDDTAIWFRYFEDADALLADVDRKDWGLVPDETWTPLSSNLSNETVRTESGRSMMLVWPTEFRLTCELPSGTAVRSDVLPTKKILAQLTGRNPIIEKVRQLHRLYWQGQELLRRLVCPLR